MEENRKYMDVNRQRWDEMAEVHSKESSYNLEDFRAGKSVLNWLERELLGDLSNQKVLHLQCHFGLDTISLLRVGAAEVVGVDYSESAIRIARELAAEFGANARFVHSNIMDLAENFDEDESFDWVFTSYGTIVWLPDLRPWARAIAKFLKPGGKFLIIDSHPFSHVFDDETSEPRLEAVYRYFDREAPEHYKVSGSYATAHEFAINEEYIWTHSLQSIFAALLAEDLQIEEFREYPTINWQMFPFLEKAEDGWYHFPNDWKQSVIPLCFALVVRKPE